MSFKFNSAVLLISSLVTGAGAWAGYEIYKPRTIEGLVEWKGLKLVSKDNANIWKALYFQGSDELGNIATDYITLRTFCVKALKEKIIGNSKKIELFEKFCLDNLKTRKAKIIAEGLDLENFLSTDDDFKLAFIFNRYSKSFLDLLGLKGNGQEIEIEDRSEILTQYRNYCENQLLVDDSKIALLKQICTKQHKYKTALEKLKNDGYELKTEQDLKDEWEKYKDTSNSDKYRVGNTLLVDIKDSEDEDAWIKLQNNKEEFGQKFNKWCSSNKDTELFKKNFYKEVYPKFKARCAKLKSQD